MIINDLIDTEGKKQISNYGRRINEKILADIVIPKMKVKEVYVKLLRPLVKKPTSQKAIEKLLANDDINWQHNGRFPRKNLHHPRDLGQSGRD